MNVVYLRLCLYVFSSFIGLLPASFGGHVRYDAATAMLSIDMQAVILSLTGGVAMSMAVWRRWGVK